MGCNSPGATHHLACDCREDAICKEVAGLRERLAASEKAREEADAYAGRANARIADLGERLDATEAVLRDAESRAARLGEALRACVVAMKRWSAEEDGLPVAPVGAHEAVAAAEAIVGYVWAGYGPGPTRAAIAAEEQPNLTAPAEEEGRDE